MVFDLGLRIEVDASAEFLCISLAGSSSVVVAHASARAVKSRSASNAPLQSE